ncbi:MAG: hypothetical protein H0U51_02670 [Propionibacteriales bacterium]|nr:hypothetical protein [Propionibacteriales bacterium]
MSSSALVFGAGLGITMPAQAASDADGDGMPNIWEASHGLNPQQANAKGDPDRDRLRNIAEYRNSADPHDERPEPQ